ncbi:MAG: beta strand repeat-containing protein [Hyphomicrobiaceae bacterium]
MATYTHNGLAGSPTGFWFTRDIVHTNAASYISASSSLIVYLNSDGSETRLISAGNDFTFTTVGSVFTLTGGTITAAQRTNAGGTTIYETISGGTGYLATAFQSHLAESDLQGVAAELLSGTDTLNGGGLNDFFRAFGDNDIINGGGGFDTVSYQHASMVGPVTITVGTSNVAGAATVSTGLATAASPTIGTDTLDSIEQFVGTSAGDSFTAFRNFLAGNVASLSSFNEFEGLGGVDTITGNGNTRIAFGNSFTAGPGATVVWTSGTNNGSGTSTGTGIGTDTFSGVSAVRGSNFVDTFTATGASTAFYTTSFFGFVFDGRGGNDIITGGGTNKRYDGNLARYDNETSNITATIGTSNTVGAPTTAAGSVTGTSPGTDTLSFVESIRGTNNATGDVYTAFADFRGLFGAFNQFEGMAGNDSITGNNQTRVGFSQSTGAVSVTWTPTVGNVFTGAGQAVGNTSVGTDTFTGVNSVRGSGFADTFTATGAHGDFTFNGAGGDDIINGGTFSIGTLGMVDFDTAQYTGASAGITVSLGAASTVAGNASVGTDTLVHVEKIRGSHFNDSYTATLLFAASYGLLNVFDPGGGDDTITGNGSTRLDYNSALAGVTVDLGLGTAQSTVGVTADIGVDNFTGVNAVEGSDFGDVLIGSNGALAEQFTGEAGADTINGGGGVRDQVRYRTSIAGVLVDLSTGQANDGYGFTDTLSGIEDASGSEFNDTITGDGNANYLVGQDGDDTLNGGDNDDILIGDDTNINFYGGVFGVSSEVDDGNDTLNGGNGNDTLIGGLGVDKMNGGAGNDIVYWDAGDDLANVLGGADTDALWVIDLPTPLTFDLAAHEFESAHVVRNDLTNTQAWSNIAEDYTPAWQLSQQRTTNDNATSSLIVYDVAGANPWSSVTSNFDTAGQTTSTLFSSDDGTAYGSVYDATGTQAYNYYISYQDNQGRQTGTYTLNDNGTATSVINDAAGAQSFTYSLNNLDALGNITSSFTQEDSGVAYGTSYDVANAFTHAFSSNFTNTGGQIITVQTRYDDGTLISVSYDPTSLAAPNGTQTWSTLTDYIDAQGRQTAQGAVYDNGTSIAAYFDYLNVQPWTYEAFVFNALGQQTDHYFV